ncbi:hypothetical protein ACP4OV_002211 [Aristida adscensionis]
MEVAAVTATTGALGPVLAKLCALLGDGNNRLEVRREKGDIELLKSELEGLYPLLLRRLPEVEDAMAEARELSYDIDDAVEGLILDLEHTTNQLQQGERKMFPFRDLRTKLGDLSKRCRQRIISSRRSKPAVDPRARFLHKDAPELVGMDTHKAAVMKLLAGDGEGSGGGGGSPTHSRRRRRRLVVCIVGFAGMGKTTLADLVYRAIAHQFQRRAFASLSPTSSTVDVLKSILRQLGDDDTSIQFAGTKATSEQHLVGYISNILADKRYLVIVDGIWCLEEWEIIGRAFPENYMDSKIILTTGVNAIAEQCSTREFIHELGGIDRYDAIMLSEAVILRESETRDLLAVNLELCGNIESISRGMPLAVHCFSAAAADSLVQGNYDGWDTWLEQVQDRFVSIRFLKPLVESLWLVYDNLPIHLKTCLLYCTAYPDFLSEKVLTTEVQSSDRHGLLRKWIAEGFVSKLDAAEAYFDELVSRNLLLPHHSGQRFFQVHPVMLPFLVCKSKEANFFTHWPDNRGTRRIRRLFIHHPLDEESCPHSRPYSLGGMEPTLSHTRSLVVSFRGQSAAPRFGQDTRWYAVISKLQMLKHLRVLDLEEMTKLRNGDLPFICQLLSLRYLGLKGCSRITALPPEIGGLQNLQTLDISSTGVSGLPMAMGKLQNLESLDISNTEVRHLPTEVGELQSLETLNVSSTRITEVPREIGKVQHLKALNVSNTRVIELPWEGSLLSNSVRVIAGDKNSPQLVKFSDGLGAVWRDLEKGVIAQSSGAKCRRQDLSILLFDHFGVSSGPLPVTGLKVASRHTGIPQWLKQRLADVSSLDIRLCRLLEEDLEFLRQMPNLQVLALRFETLPREPMVIATGGFAKLESFLVDCRLPLASFEQGAMPKLKHLEFKFYTGRATSVQSMGITRLRSIENVVFRCSGYYRSDCPGITAILGVVRKEAAEHTQRISLWINDKEEVFPEKDAGGEVCEEHVSNVAGAGSSEGRGMKTSMLAGKGMGKALQIRNRNYASGSRTIKTHEIQEVQE